VSTGTNDIDDLRRRMATIRRDLHHDVREVVATAEAATDWRKYISAYPMLSLGAAFAAGYLIVPRRRKPDAAAAMAAVATQASLSKVEKAVESAKQAVIETAQERAEPRKSRKGLITGALGLIGPFALRAAQGYAMSYLENWIAQQQTTVQANAGPPPSTTARAPSGGSPGRSAGPPPRTGSGAS